MLRSALRVIASGVFIVTLAACGGGSGGGGAQGAADEPCPILADASSVFRHPVSGFVDSVDGAALACRYSSEDGLIDAGFARFDANADAQFQSLSEEWRKDNYGAVSELSGLGDSALIGTHMAGNQTVIMVRKGDGLALIQVSSGDTSRDAEISAKAFAEAFVAAWQ